MAGQLRGNVIAGGRFNQGAFASRGQSVAGSILTAPGELPVKGFLFGGVDDLTAAQGSAISAIVELLPHRGQPEVAVHDADRVDLVFSSPGDLAGDDTVRVSLDEVGKVTRFGHGEFWAEDDDWDHSDAERLDAAGLVSG